MDGTGIRLLVEGKNIEWPNGLSIDYAEDKIYWVDARFVVLFAITSNDYRLWFMFSSLLFFFSRRNATK